jgi:hypothetical protein
MTISAIEIGFVIATPIVDSSSGNFNAQDSVCGVFSGGGDVSDCEWCTNYLSGLGSQACVVDRNDHYPPEFCGHGGCKIYGTLPNGISVSQSSWYVTYLKTLQIKKPLINLLYLYVNSSDVASGAQYVIDHCSSNGHTNGR